MDSTDNIPAENAENTEQIEKIDLDVDIQEISTCERRIKVTVPRTEIDRYFDLEFKELTNTAHVPGFRKGSAPRRVIEKRFRKEIGERVKGVLVQACLAQVMDEPEITPISEPDFKFESIVLPDSGPMVFEFNLEVRPEFDLPDWRGITIEIPNHEFTPEEVERATNQFLEQYAKLVPSDTPAEEDDFIVTKLTFRHNDQIISQANEETLRIRPVLSFSDGVVNDFAKLMVGVKSGDQRVAKANLTEDTPNPALRGAEVEATFDILEVKKLELPELTHDFLERIGEFDNVGDFKDGILDTLKQQLAYEQRQQIRQQILRALTVSASWDLPPSILEKQADRELERMVMELRSSGYSNDEIQREINHLRQNSRAVVAQALKEHFILEKIADVENIKDLPEDYDVEIKMIADHSQESPRRVRAQLEKQGKMDILRNQVIERKVIELIKANAKFVEVPYELEGITEEAIEHIASRKEQHEIPEATEEDLKAVGKEAEEKRMIDPNAK